MHRRGDRLSRAVLFGTLGALLAVGAFVVLVSVLFFAGGGSSSLDLPPIATSADAGDAGSGVPATPDFYPEENNLGDCLGLVERPGCGSESRGGWGQTAVFVLLVAGLAIILWRVTVGVRRNRERIDA